MVKDYDIFRAGSSGPTGLVTYNPGPGERLYFGANAGDFRGQTLYSYEQGTVFPVELAGFEAATDTDAVRLTWRTASETNNAGFHVERAVDDGAFADLHFVPGGGTTDRARTYRFTDGRLPFAAEQLTYRLRQVDHDGAATLSAPVTITISAPDALALDAPFPNPTRGTATLRFALPTAGPVEIALYNVLGQRIATPLRDVQPAGRAERRLDTTGLPSGLYFLQLIADDQVRTQRLTVVQ